MRSYYQDLKLDDGSAVTVEYQWAAFSAELFQAIIVDVWRDRDDGSYTVKLTDAERDRMEEWLVEHHPHPNDE